jgi:hypothetical protein
MVFEMESPIVLQLKLLGAAFLIDKVLYALATLLGPPSTAGICAARGVRGCRPRPQDRFLALGETLEL